LKIAGAKGWEDKSIYERMKNMDNVEYLGYVSNHEKYNLLQNAMAYINPSSYEGLGLPLFEAMQLGVPMLLNNNAAFKEIAYPYAIFPGSKSEKWSIEICKILNEPQYNFEWSKKSAEALSKIKKKHIFQSEKLTQALLA